MSVCKSSVKGKANRRLSLSSGYGTCPSPQCGPFIVRSARRVYAYEGLVQIDALEEKMDINCIYAFSLRVDD